MELALDLSMHLTCYHNFLESGPLKIFVYSQSHDKMAKLMTSDLKARASAFSATVLSLLEHSPGKQLCSIRADACCACVPCVRACGVKSASMLGTNLAWALYASCKQFPKYYTGTQICHQHLPKQAAQKSWQNPKQPQNQWMKWTMPATAEETGCAICEYSRRSEAWSVFVCRIEVRRNVDCEIDRLTVHLRI